MNYLTGHMQWICKYFTEHISFVIYTYNKNTQMQLWHEDFPVPIKTAWWFITLNVFENNQIVGKYFLKHALFIPEILKLGTYLMQDKWRCVINYKAQAGHHCVQRR